MFSKIFILFIIYSFLGFIWESFFCLFQYKGWSRRGFLYGPICPIYGVGALCARLLINNCSYLNINGEYFEIKIFIIASVGSFILEWCTATILEKIFHAAWWDYSMFPLNIQGKVCLFCTLGFGIGGIIIPKYLMPFIDFYVNRIPLNFYEPIAFILVAIFAADFTLTVSTLSDFSRKVNNLDKAFNSKMEEIVDGVIHKGNIAKEKISEEKEKIIDFNIQRFTEGKTLLYTKAINRISGFKFHSKNSIAKKIKEKLNKKHNSFE